MTPILAINPSRSRHHVRRIHQRGFSSVDMLIAVVIMGILFGAATSAFEPVVRFYRRINTQQILATVDQAITQAYSANFTIVEAHAGALFTLPLGTINPALATGSTGICSSTSSSLAPLALYLTSSASASYRDGGSLPMCIFITPQITTSFNGYTVQYHVIAIVSAGPDGKFDATTGLSSTGVLTLGGDDQGIVVSGLPIAQANVTTTLSKISTIVNALSQYYQGQYEASSARDASMDYFANTDSSGATSNSYDSNGALISSMGGTITLAASGAQTALGVSSTDMQDGFGNPLYFDNSSPATRNPSNSTATMNYPPFSALVTAILPSGQEITMSATSTY